MIKLHPPSKLLVRNVAELDGARILAVDSPDGELGRELAQQYPQARITLHQTEYGDYLRAKAWADGQAGLRADVRFGAWYENRGQAHDVAVVYLPKSRALLDLTLDMVAGALAIPTTASDSPARVFLVGPVRGGIKSSKPALEQRFGSVKKVDAARHCVLYSATMTDQTACRSRLEDSRTSSVFDVAGRTLQVFSYPGVFSHDRLDDGTRMLLETFATCDGVPSPAGASGAAVLDFGCGCGVIGAWLHAGAPGVPIEMVDSSAFALEAARRTAEINGLDRGCAYPSDVFSDVRGRYRMIVSNPPFHAGIETDYAVVQRFLTDAADRLVNGGTIRLVANRFHKYKPLLKKYVGPCRNVAEDARYRVYEAVVER